MNRQLLTLTAVLLLVGMALPVQADSCDSDNGCESPGNGNDENSGKNGNETAAQDDVEPQDSHGPEPTTEYCKKHPGHPRCVEQNIEDTCQVITIIPGIPQPGVWDPILGIIDFHPEQCYKVYARVMGYQVLVYAYPGTS